MSVNDIIMSSQENKINLLKQIPFYGKTIKPRVKGFTKEQKIMTKNTIACLVYKILLQKKNYLITKNNVY